MANIEFELQPFTVPNFVVVQVPTATFKQEGFKELPSLPLNQVPRKVLEQMCKDFTKAVMEKWEAGKPQKAVRTEEAAGDRPADRPRSEGVTA
jgi:hypothetical protein